MICLKTDLIGFDHIRYTKQFNRDMFKNRPIEVKIKLCKNRIKKLNQCIKSCEIEINNVKKYMECKLNYED